MQVRSDVLFHSLHTEGLLMLANCWDAGSARIAAQAGSTALATSSAAVAWSYGYADGSQLPRDLLLATARHIARVTSLPLSLDIEDGYSSDPEQVAALAADLIDAGIVGINIEDGSDAPDLLCRKIEAVRHVADARQVKLFVNVRTDVYLRGLVTANERLAETIQRARRYQEAGASGLFVPGMCDEGEIAAIAKATPLPLNLLALPGLAAPARLSELGVRRLSAGSAISEVMFGCIDAVARQFLATGAVRETPYAQISYSQLNGVMAKRA